MPPGANQGRQAGNQPHRIAAPAHPLQPVVHANRHRLPALRTAAVVLCQRADLHWADAANACRPLGGPLQGTRAHQVPAQGVVVQVGLVQPVMGDQLMHQGQCQRGIGAGQQCQVFMAFFCRLAAPRIDTYQLGALALGLLGIAPKMQVAGDGVAAPDQDQLGLRKKLHPHAELAAQSVHQTLAAGRCADGALQQRGAKLVEKSRRHAVALHQAHGAGIAVGQDGLCGVATARHDGLQPRRNIAQRGVPTHGYKLSAALWAAALEWPQHPFGVVAALGVAGHLGTQSTCGLGMRRVTLHLDGHAERDGG